LTTPALLVGAHQNFNGSCDLTMTLTGMVCHSWTSKSTINLSATFEISISADY